MCESQRSRPPSGTGRHCKSFERWCSRNPHWMRVGEVTLLQTYYEAGELFQLGIDIVVGVLVAVGNLADGLARFCGRGSSSALVGVEYCGGISCFAVVKGGSGRTRGTNSGRVCPPYISVFLYNLAPLFSIFGFQLSHPCS